eukprot:280839-Ditylum_brightwellii.AAC.1
MDYYNEVKKNIDVKKNVCDEADGFVPSIDNFFKNLLPMYLDEGDKHIKSLMYFLLKNYIAKSNGYQNLEYGSK